MRRSWKISLNKKREKCSYVCSYNLIRHYELNSTFKVHLHSPTCFGVGHHHHRGRQHHTPYKHRYQKVSICSCTHRYIACAPSTQGTLCHPAKCVLVCLAVPSGLDFTLRGYILWRKNAPTRSTLSIG